MFRVIFIKLQIITIIKLYVCYWKNTCMHCFIASMPEKSCFKSPCWKSLIWFPEFIDWDSSAAHTMHCKESDFQCCQLGKSHTTQNKRRAHLLFFAVISIWQHFCNFLSQSKQVSEFSIQFKRKKGQEKVSHFQVLASYIEQFIIVWPYVITHGSKVLICRTWRFLKTSIILENWFFIR